MGLFSAVTLALANVAVKRGQDILVARAVLSTSAALLVAPFTLIVPLPDAAVWQALAWAIPAHFLYQICLVRAMQRGDLSLVFPIMRGAAPLMTAGAAVLVFGEHLPPIGWIGLLIATVAVVAFALPAKGVGLRAHPDKVAVAWALATAVGIVLYNMTDARGVRAAGDPFTYIVWLFLLDFICITLTAIALRRRTLLRAALGTWRSGAAGGLLSVLSFGAALYGYTLVEIAKISALRETAVVWAALIGVVFMKEGMGKRRLIAAIALALGLILLQFA